MKILQATFTLFALLFSQSPILAQTTYAEIQGEIIDQTGAVITGARANLILNDQTVNTARSDERGRFVFGRVAAGAYILRVEMKGFAALNENIRVEDAQKTYRFAVTLFPEINENVTVDDSLSASPLESERAAGTLRLTQKEIEALPDDSDALNEQLQQLAATSGSAPGGAIVMVDGFLAGAFRRNRQFSPFASTRTFIPPNTTRRRFAAGASKS